SIVGEIGLLFTLAMFFWAIFDQSASTWIFYADACMKNDFFGWTAEQMQSLNAWLIVGLVPVVNFFFVTLDNAGYRVRATDKMLVTGLWLLAVGVANLVVNAPLSWVYPHMAPGPYFAMLAGLLVVVTIGFVFVAQKFNRTMAEKQEKLAEV